MPNGPATCRPRRRRAWRRRWRAGGRRRGLSLARGVCLWNFLARTGVFKHVRHWRQGGGFFHSTIGLFPVFSNGNELKQNGGKIAIEMCSTQYAKLCKLLPSFWYHYHKILMPHVLTDQNVLGTCPLRFHGRSHNFGNEKPICGNGTKMTVPRYIIGALGVEVQDRFWHLHCEVPNKIAKFAYN